MYKADINNGLLLNIDPKHEDFEGWDIIELGDNQYHIILPDHRSFRAILLRSDLVAKTFTFEVNGEQFVVNLKDKMDVLLEKMGISTAASNKIKDIKAPMPGLVLELKVAVGDALSKGDPVLILEAMKMENVLKAAGEGTVKSIDIKQGDAVEKGEILIHLE